MEQGQVICLDTQTVVFLYLGEVSKFSPAAREAIEKHDLLVSPAVVLELEYLHEIGRLVPRAAEVIVDLSDRIGLTVCDLAFRTIVRQAVSEKWSRDPFDRLIVAHAKVQKASLVTRDERIREHYRLAVW
jgi:PIN domain nuclease of toxin-antitoxin system